MPISYRIYTIGRGGHFLGCPEVVECCDDKEAVEKAMQLASGFDVEIWDISALSHRSLAFHHGNLQAGVPYQPENRGRNASSSTTLGVTAALSSLWMIHSSLRLETNHQLMM